jgi:hypothetical protein
MSTPVDDVESMQAMLDRAGIKSDVVYYTGASKEGFRTFISTKSDATSSETVFTFDHQNRLVAISSYERP